MSRPVFIAGATGKQGGALIRALLDHPSFDEKTYVIYAMTRDPASASAKRLGTKSPAIKLVQGDLNDVPQAFKNLPVKPWGTFILTNPQKKPKPEDVIGKTFVDEAIKAGSKHIVFTSVARGSANGGFNPTDVPHFITKHEIEGHLMEKTKDTDVTYTIIRPVFFLDNFDWGFIGKVITTAWRDNVKGKLQVVATEDIGKIAANAFLQSDLIEYKNKAIPLAGDDLTFGEANEIFKAKVGRDLPTTFGFLSTLMLWLVRDVRLMFNFFDRSGFQVNIEEVKKLSAVSTFSQWLDHSSFMKKTA